MRALTKRERDGALMVDAHGHDGHILMHRYHEGLVGQPPCFGDLEYKFTRLLLVSHF